MAVWCHVAKDDRNAADRLLSRLFQASQRLGYFPELGPKRPSLGENMRALPVQRYLIIYTVEAYKVQIARVLHGMRDVDTLMSEKE